MVDYMIMYNIYSKAKLFTYNRIVFPIFGDYIMEDCRSYANDNDLAIYDRKRFGNKIVFGKRGEIL